MLFTTMTRYMEYVYETLRGCSSVELVQFFLLHSAKTSKSAEIPRFDAMYTRFVCYLNVDEAKRCSHAVSTRCWQYAVTTRHVWWSAVVWSSSNEYDASAETGQQKIIVLLFVFKPKIVYMPHY
jgi:hypothetical protein